MQLLKFLEHVRLKTVIGRMEKIKIHEEENGFLQCEKKNDQPLVLSLQANKANRNLRGTENRFSQTM